MAGASALSRPASFLPASLPAGVPTLRAGARPATPTPAPPPPSPPPPSRPGLPAGPEGGRSGLLPPRDRGGGGGGGPTDNAPSAPGRVLHDLLEGRAVHPRHVGKVLQADRAEDDVVHGRVALASALVSAIAGPGRRVRGSVG